MGAAFVDLAPEAFSPSSSKIMKSGNELGELYWWKGKYFCTQSSASLAVVEGHRLPYILESRGVSRGIKGSQRAAEQVAVCSANTTGQWRGS